MENDKNTPKPATDVYNMLCAGFIDVTKRKKPKIGRKVLVKMVYKSGKVDYNVAIYTVCGYDKIIIMQDIRDYLESL